MSAELRRDFMEIANLLSIDQAALIAYGWSPQDSAARKRKRLLEVEREACKQDIRTADQHIATWERRRELARVALAAITTELGQE